MSRDYDIAAINPAEIEQKARELRAQAVASGMRSFRDWTIGVFQHRR